MKFLKVLGGILLALIIGLVVLVLVCADNPELTEKIAEFLYPDRYNIAGTESGTGEIKEGAENVRGGAGRTEGNAGEAGDAAGNPRAGSAGNADSDASALSQGILPGEPDRGNGNGARQDGT